MFATYPMPLPVQEPYWLMSSWLLQLLAVLEQLAGQLVLFTASDFEKLKVKQSNTRIARERKVVCGNRFSLNQKDFNGSQTLRYGWLDRLVIGGRKAVLYKGSLVIQA